MSKREVSVVKLSEVKDRRNEKSTRMMQGSSMKTALYGNNESKHLSILRGNTLTLREVDY